jgi:hypothetical protein
MAADLAVIMQTSTKQKRRMTSLVCKAILLFFKAAIPNTKPINANGIAKMVCENFTKLK